jgi:glycosyltransferase involved in cell wall biosynthesis
MRALHVSAYFAPAFRYGGPPRSILGLCQALGKAGADVEVFTTTANADDPLPPAPDGVIYEGVRVRYFPLAWPPIGWRASGLAGALTRAARGADLVHVHGLWNFTAWAGVRAARSAGIPYVISPRGMLQPEAMAHHHQLKAIAYPTVERRHLQGASLLHATSDSEARVLAACGPRVALVANGVTARAATADQIARMRQQFARVRRSGRAACLVIAGPDEGGHRRRIEPLFRDIAADVRWTGAVDGDDKWALLHASRALVQCSDSESFGLSVAEALSAGVPVVVTERGAWSHLASVGCGHVVAHDAQAIADALDRLLADPQAARAMGERGRAWATRTFGWDAIGQAMLRQYESVTGRLEVAAS